MKKITLIAIALMISIYGFAQKNNDVKFFGLKGTVKQCTTYSMFDYESDWTKGESIEFTATGIVKGVVYERVNNRIVARTYSYEGWGGKVWVKTKFKYNNVGRVVEELTFSSRQSPQDLKPNCKYVYTYDSMGNVNTCTNIDLAGTGRVTLITKYEYLEFDKKGNWIKRKYEDPMTLNEVLEKRLITYY